MFEKESLIPKAASSRLKRLLGRTAGEEKIIANNDGTVTIGNLTVDNETAKTATPEGLRLMSAFYSGEGEDEQPRVELRVWDDSNERPPMS